jgi:outer membrane lipoprotein-sorting protein
VPELFLKENNVKVSLTGIEQVDGNDAYTVEYNYASGGKSTVYFDVNSFLKVQTVKAVDTPQGSGTQTIAYKDYKEVSGVMFPHTIIQSFGPQTLKAEITSIEVNVPIEDAAFTVEK